MSYFQENISSVQDMAVKWSVPASTIKRWCELDMIEAKQVGKEWAIQTYQYAPSLDLPIAYKGIKKAVSEFNKHIGYASIYLDLVEHKVWCVTYERALQVSFINKENTFLIAHKVEKDKDRTMTMKEVQEQCDRYKKSIGY